MLDLVAQDVLLCSCVNLIGRWGEVASDPQAPLQSHDDQAGDDNVCPSLTSSRSDLSSRHQFSLSSSARSAISGSLQSPVKCVGRAVLSASCLTLRHCGWYVACQAPLSLGILLARILEWVAFPFSRGSSQPRDQTQVSCTAGRFFTI